LSLKIFHCIGGDGEDRYGEGCEHGDGGSERKIGDTGASGERRMYDQAIEIGRRDAKNRNNMEFWK
jgi:hypothetical protein